MSVNHNTSSRIIKLLRHGVTHDLIYACYICVYVYVNELMIGINFAKYVTIYIA